MLNISILGGGWLGIPLGEQLKEEHDVIVSYRKGTTKNNIEEAGLEPWYLDLDDDDLDPDFFDTDVLIIAIPPGVRTDGGNKHLTHLRKILDQLDEETNVIYCNSTAIYQEGIDLAEDEANKNSVFYHFERELKTVLNDRLTIVRLGGLVGGERIIVNSIIEKQVSVNPNDPVNFVHLIDVVNSIDQIIELECWGEVLNVVAPEHPNKKDVYDYWSMVKEVPGEVIYTDLEKAKVIKTISPSKIIQKLNFDFKYCNPLHFF